VPEYKQQIDELAELMEEFRLGEAQLQTGELRIAFRRRSAARVVLQEAAETVGATGIETEDAPEAPAEPATPTGMPIISPINGIYYGSPSPGSAPFVREGDEVQVDQVLALIEAMKVFNEIKSPINGAVQKLVSESGAIVQPGDVLLYVG